ncbi:MAG: ABC transporter substrate-binding protein, partial [Burkholderiales bacterium]|nr:ABC transporter substrate-binding protein [Burkholderiales bacterium]
SREAALDAGLREHGFTPGREIRLERRCHQNLAQARAIIDEFVRNRVDLIFVGTPEPAAAARAATREIPIVCGSCGDPLVNGLAESLARPGGNFTGMASLSAELIGKRVELLREAVPGLSRIAVLLNPANPGTPAVQRALEAATRATGIGFSTATFRALGDFDAALDAVAASGARAVLIQDDPYTFAARVRIGELVVRHRLAAVAGSPEFADAGTLIAYGPSRDDLYRRAAGQIHKILKGAKPGELPIEQADKYDFVINARTARALGLALAPALRLRADRVVD